MFSTKRRKEVKSKKRKDKIKQDCEESSHKKSRLSSADETSKKKDKGKRELKYNICSHY